LLELVAKVVEQADRRHGRLSGQPCDEPVDEHMGEAFHLGIDSWYRLVGQCLGCAAEIPHALDQLLGDAGDGRSSASSPSPGDCGAGTQSENRLRIHPAYANASKDRANDCSPATTDSEHMQAVRARTQRWHGSRAAYNRRRRRMGG
jgi:hypothetical protein